MFFFLRAHLFFELLWRYKDSIIMPGKLEGVIWIYAIHYRFCCAISARMSSSCSCTEVNLREEGPWVRGALTHDG